MQAGFFSLLVYVSIIGLISSFIFFLLILQARGKKRQKGWFPASHVKLLGPSSERTTPAFHPGMKWVNLNFILEKFC